MPDKDFYREVDFSDEGIFYKLLLRITEALEVIASQHAQQEKRHAEQLAFQDTMKAFWNRSLDLNQQHLRLNQLNRAEKEFRSQPIGMDSLMEMIRIVKWFEESNLIKIIKEEVKKNGEEAEKGATERPNT